MSISPISSRIMTSACSAHLWPHSHLNMDLSIYTPTWHRVLLFGKYSGFPNPTGSHPVHAVVLFQITNKADSMIPLSILALTKARTDQIVTVANPRCPPGPTSITLVFWACSGPTCVSWSRRRQQEYDCYAPYPSVHEKMNVHHNYMGIIFKLVCRC